MQRQAGVGFNLWGSSEVRSGCVLVCKTQENTARTANFKIREKFGAPLKIGVDDPAGASRPLSATIHFFQFDVDSLFTNPLGNQIMATNRGVAYIKPGVVEVQSIDFPKLEDPTNGKKIEHGVILKIVSTNICGCDQHMVRGRTTAPAGPGPRARNHRRSDRNRPRVEFIKKGDIVSVPFNIACGRCRNCKEGRTGICLNVNPARPGAAYGYVDMGGWVGGQAEYVMVPYADFNLLKFPDKAQAMAKIKDLTLLSDIFPTGYHGAVTAGVGPGTIVYVAGAGPVGLACAASCHLLGAAVVIVGDMIPERLAQAKSFGCETIDLNKDAHARPSRSSRSSACRKSIARSIASASKRTATARMPRSNSPPPCSTRS